jgi:hypothetical protein
MPPSRSPSLRPVVCRRGFEPSRVQQQLLSEAYGHVAPQARQRRAATPASQPQRRASAASASARSCSASPVSYGGCCA